MPRLRTCVTDSCRHQVASEPGRPVSTMIVPHTLPSVRSSTNGAKPGRVDGIAAAHKRVVTAHDVVPGAAGPNPDRFALAPVLCCRLRTSPQELVRIGGSRINPANDIAPAWSVFAGFRSPWVAGPRMSRTDANI